MSGQSKLNSPKTGSLIFLNWNPKKYTSGCSFWCLDSGVFHFWSNFFQKKPSIQKVLEEKYVWNWLSMTVQLLWFGLARFGLELGILTWDYIPSNHFTYSMPNHTKSYQTIPNHTKSYQTTSTHTKPYQNFFILHFKTKTHLNLLAILTQVKLQR